MTPEYISSLTPLTVGGTTRNRLRNESDLQTIPAKSQQYYHSFLPSVTRAWNSLSEEACLSEERMLNRSASFAMSTSVLKALPGKLDIKRHRRSSGADM